MIGLTIFFGIIGLCVWAWKADNKQHERSYKIQLAIVENFLREENLKPKLQVVVHTKAERSLLTKPFEPTSEVEYWGTMGYSSWQNTSRDNAEAFIESVVKSGRYKHTDGTYVPMCEIESMKVVGDGT
jgi:nitrogen fixation-related uncharacterized protein